MFKRREWRAEEPGPYWNQRSWKLSAGFLGLVFVIGGIAALTSGQEAGGVRTDVSASDGPLSDPSVTKSGRPQGCRTDDSAGDALPKAAPKDVSWRTLGLVRVPVSTSAGPTRIQGPLWWCFAHTPTGAVLAAHIIPSQMGISRWRTVTEKQVVAGQGRDMWEFQRSTVQPPDGQDSTTSVASYVGFSVASYTSKTTNVRLLLKSDRGYAATNIVLRWSGGDWKVLPDSNGSLYSPVTALQSTSGFTLWEG